MRGKLIDRTAPTMKSVLLIFVAATTAALLVSVPVATLAKGPGGATGVSHTAWQTRPIKLGTSGGWALDLANGYCCGGTLGALIDIGGIKYILSNWHVFSMDTATGGNGIVAQSGDPIIQPGLIDVGCNKDNAQIVGSLAITPSPEESNVDAAIAAVEDGMVSPEGEILEVGLPSSTTVAAFVGQAVKKSGRTSKLTRSKVSGLYATVSVAYETECAGSHAFTKPYTGQILVANRGNKFLKSGDSGSLLLEDVTNFPRAVGLLFAGSSTIAVANPIDDVLETVDTSKLGATMVGAATAGVVAPAGPMPAIDKARAAQLRNLDVLERVPDNTGHAIGFDQRGRVVIQVLVEADSPRARAAAPRSLDGVPVEVVVVGKIVAY